MRATLLLATLVFAAAYSAAEGDIIRLCASAGRLFPESEEGLRSTVVRLLEEADAPLSPDPLFACVVPHGPYGISGKIAASAFKHLQKGQYKRVIVLGASHAGVEFEDCSIDAVDAYATPMGFVPLDKVAVRTLTYSTLFSTRSLRYNHNQRGFLSESERKPIHEYEHSIELVLPFLQERLGNFELVPILVGRLTDGTGKFSEKRAEAAATQIRRIMDAETLLVVSTDFTHYGNDFGFRPFGTDVFNKIEKLDMAGLTRLAANDFDEFESFIRRTKVPICGLDALRVLHKLLPANAHGTLIARDTSGRFYNDENRSVSYAAMNFHLSEVHRPRVEPIQIDITRLEAPTAAPEAPPAPEPMVAPAPSPEKPMVDAPAESVADPAEPVRTEAPEPVVVAPPEPEEAAPPAAPAGPRPAPITITNIRRGGAG